MLGDRGRPRKRFEVRGARALTRHDLEGYVSEGPPQIKKLRESHHRLARLFAQGVRNHEIAEATGYSRQRVNDLQRDPMFQELIARYREELNETWKEDQRDYYGTLNKGRDIAAQLATDWMQELRDGDVEDIPIRTVIALHDTFADRTGFGRKQTNYNINVDVKARLDQALRRTREITGPSLTHSTASLNLTVLPKAEGDPSPPPPQPRLVSQRVVQAPEPMRVGSSPAPFRRLR